MIVKGSYFGFVMGMLLGTVLGLLTITLAELTSTPRSCPIVNQTEVL